MERNDNGQPENIGTELDIDTLKRYIFDADHDYQTAQHRLCFAIIARIYKRVLKNYYFGDIKIDGNMIVEGNHRYIAYVLANVKFAIVKGTRSHCDNTRNFNEIHIDTVHDWDANNLETKKYCNDDFLKDGEYFRT